MYTATMEYEFKAECFDNACSIWKNDVLESAETQPGFVRMQFLTAAPRAPAIGTWEKPEDAARFMQTGVFKELMLKLRNDIAAEPVPRIWDLRYFSGKQV